MRTRLPAERYSLSPLRVLDDEEEEAELNEGQQTPHTPKQALPFQGDVEAAAVVFCRLEDDGPVDSDEHLECKRQFHLSQLTGDQERHETTGSGHTLIVPLAQRVWRTK